MVRNLNIKSLMGRHVSWCIDCGTTFPPLSVRYPLSISLFLRVGIGALMSIIPVGLRLQAPLDFFLASAVSRSVHLLISVPRNLTWCSLTLVISVFSKDSSSFSSSQRYDPMRLFSFSASSLRPHTPITQSSAYLTYLILQIDGSRSIFSP